MAGKPSAIGFGFQPFGQFAFGSADWAEEVTWGVSPQFIKDDDTLCQFDPPLPLRKFLDALKPQLQDLLDKWEIFPDLWDANKVPIEQLGQLGYNFDIVPSQSKDEGLQRSEVLNAIQFFISKGTDQGYEIAGAFSNLLVTITPYWADSCGSGASLQEEEPTEFFARFDAFPADLIPTDAVFTDFYEKWPHRLDWRLPCRSAWLKLFFFSPDDTEIEDFSAVAEAVVINVERVRPIHVRIAQFKFDGPRASAGGWTMPVRAENSASGGGWTMPVVGELRSAGGGWTIPVLAVPTP